MQHTVRQPERGQVLAELQNLAAANTNERSQIYWPGARSG
jgi:hypothetical protein